MALQRDSVLCTIPSRDGRIQEDVRGAAMLTMRRAAQSGVRTEYLRNEERYCVVNARNRAVAALLRSDFTHLLFIDDDVRADHDTITKLLACESDVAAGCYVILREESGIPLPVLSVKVNGEWERMFFSGMREVDAAGTGCMLIHRDVFADVGEPGRWFRWPTWLNDDGVLEQVSDDVDFCNRAKAAGKRIVAHGDVRCGHMRNVDLTLLLAIHQFAGAAT